MTDLALDLQIDVEFQKIQKKFADAPQEVNKRMRRAMTKATGYVSQRAKTVAPFRRGNLRRSITDEVKGFAYDVQGRVGTNLKYGYVHEFGGTYTFRRNSAFGRTTKPFSYQATYRERAYLRTSLSESADTIQKIFDDEFRDIFAV